MSVPEGFKQTEVGVIPKDWEVSSLFEIVNVIDGDRGVNYPSKSDLKPTGYCLFLNAGNVTKEGFVFGKNEFIGKDKHISLHNGTLERNDIVLTTRGTVGNFAYFHHLIPFDIIRINSGMVILRADTTQCESSYLYCALTSNVTSNQIKQLSFGSAQPQLTVSGIKQILCPLPPTRAEQTAIAAALGDMDALIEGVEKLLEKKRRIKQGAMQELLTGKRRVSGFESQAGFQQTEIGAIPQDWEVKLLGELFEITSSKRVFQSEWKNSGIPFYRARELAVLGEKGSVDNKLFITKEQYELFKKQHGVPKVRDMLVTGVGTLGKVYVVTDEREFYFKDGNIIWFKTNKSIDPALLKQLYLTKIITKQIDDASGKTTVGTYTITGAKNTVIPLPSPAEQTAIAAILSDMDAEIEQLETQLTKYRQLKTGMMQELLTGKKRLV